MCRISWNEYFMLLAKVAALRSTCNSRPTGAIIVKDKRVIATGYNGSLPGKPQCSDEGGEFCYRRSIEGREIDKYNICPANHAEANAIAQAAKMGISIRESTMYCTLFPCLVCAKLMKISGVVKVYYELLYESSDQERDEEWFRFSKEELQAEKFQSLNHYVIPMVTSMRRLL